MAFVMFVVACGLLYPARTLIGLGKTINEWQLDIETTQGTVTVLTSSSRDELEGIAAAINRAIDN